MDFDMSSLGVVLKMCPNITLDITLVIVVVTMKTKSLLGKLFILLVCVVCKIYLCADVSVNRILWIFLLIITYILIYAFNIYL